MKNVLVGQSGGPTAVINSSLAGVYETAKACGAPHVYGMQYGIEGVLEGKLVDLDTVLGDKMDIELLKRTPSSFLGSCRHKLPDPAVDEKPFVKLFELFAKYCIGAVFYIGGNDSMDTIAKLSAYGAAKGSEIRFIGVPKTIDNDINFIPHSFGFETAVDKAADAIRCAHIEAASVFNGIGIVKLMGRESGFIAANASLSMREVNFVLVPEVPFSLYGERGLFPALEKCLAAHSHAVLAVAEGAGQDLLSEHETRCDASGNKALGDITGFLRAKIAEYFSAKKIPYYLKYIDPSYMIRSVPANANDRLYCGFLGQHAVHAAMSGKTGMVVANIMDKFVHLPLELVTRKRRTMSVRSDLWQSVLETTGQGDVMGTSPEPEQHL